MSSGSVARRYARALFDLSVESKATDDVARDLQALGDALGGMPLDDLAPGALDVQLRDRIGAAIAAKLGGSPLVGNFVRLLARRDRLAELPAIRDWFQRIRDQAEGRVRIDVVTASPLAPPQVDKLVETFSKIAGRTVAANTHVDATLLGGAVVEMEGRVFDGSVRTTLKRLSDRMAGGTGARPTQL
jgi:F-type H+-transporting ATPase subunit delta